MNPRLDFLFDRTTPKFGQHSIWLLLVFSVILAIQSPPNVEGERSETPATFLSQLPKEVLTSAATYEFVRWTLVLGAFGWAPQQFLPYTCWITAISAHVLIAMQLDNDWQSSHAFHITAWLLVIHALWFHYFREPISQAGKKKEFSKTPLYPRWVFLLSIFYIGIFHTLGGLTKLQTSGLNWANGVSLQLWVDNFGWHNSPTSQLLLNNRSLAWISQLTALVIQTGAILALFNRWLRFGIGVALIVGYVGLFSIFFDYALLLNCILVEWFFCRKLGQAVSLTTSATPDNDEAIQQ